EEFVNDVVDRLLEHLKSVKSRKNSHLYTAEFDDAALLDWTKPLTDEQEDRIAAELAKTDPELAERIFASSEEIAAAKKAYEEADAEFYKAVEAYQNEENTGTSLIPSENVVAARERMHKADNKAKEAKWRLDKVKKLRGSKLSSIHNAMRSPNDAKTLSKAFFRAGFVGHKFPAASMGLGNYSKGTNYVIYDESALQIVDKVSWLKNARGKVFGAYNSATKEVFIAKNARIDTVLHELGWHAMFDWASSNAPEFHAKMREYAASAPEAIKAQVRKAYPDLDEKSESFLDEVGAHAFSLDHYGKIEDLLKTAKDKTWWGKVKRLFQKIWKAFSKAIGKDRVDVAALSKMNYRDAVAQWAEDFVNGKRLQYPVDGSGRRNGGVREQFIGERGAAAMDAATHPLEWEMLGIRSRMQNLNVAREMEAAGKDRAAISRATGWYRGKDKKWRREIDDGKIKDGIEPHYDGEPWLALGEIYDAPELYKAYPELKEMRVEFGFLRGRLAGFDTVNEVILLPLYWLEGGKLKAKISTGGVLLPSLVHEVQHAIQKIEGFAPGGSVGMDDPRHVIRIAELKGEITEYESSLELIEEEIYEAEDAGDSELAQSLNEELNTGREELERLKKELLDLEWSDTPTLDIEGYRRLAGEVEARNVSRRLDDKYAFPWRTEDVAEEEQIAILEGMYRYGEADSAESRIAEDSSEVARIEAESKANGTWLKAPNGNPTKLNPRQWVQVRTKAFKKWFGDWEKQARIEKLKNSVPVEISGNDIPMTGNLKSDLKAAQEYAKSHRGSFKNKDTGKMIPVFGGSINELSQHDISNKAHLQSFAAIQQIIEESIYIDSRANEDKEKHPDVELYEYYVCGLKVGGVDYTVKSVVAVGLNGERYYDHKLTKIEKGALLSTTPDVTKPGEESTTPFADVKDKRLLQILQVDSSKVVDENGEPRVVYHQTENDFWTFDMGKARQSMDLPAAYFSSGTGDWADMGGRVIPAFLNLR
ncbi:MAG: hypothetical protein IJX22_01060, partial [Opitutales bacterium]|nr:hypothetical protein [Opitutales bacterium]